VLAKFFSSEQRTAQRYIKQLRQSDADQRLTLLAQMRQAQDSGELQPVPAPLKQFLNEQLAAEDNIEVKVALVAWIDDLDALASLLTSDLTVHAAAKRIVELDPKNSDLINDPRVIIERIANASPNQVHALVDLAKTPEQLATLAIRAHAQDQPHVLNQPMLCTEKGLIALEKHSRGHNKACHKHAREHLDAIKTARRAQEQALQRLQELDETIAKTLAKHAEERADLATLLQHKTRLKLLSDNRQLAMEALQKASHTLRQLDVDSPPTNTPENPLASIDLSTPSPADDPYQLVVSELEQFFGKPEEMSTDPNTAMEVLQKVHKQWLGINVDYVASDEQQRTFQRLSGQLEQYAKKLLVLSESEVDISLVANALTSEEIAQAPVSLIQQRQRWLKSTSKIINKLAWPQHLPEPQQLTAAKQTLLRLQTEVTQLLEQQSKSRALIKENVQSAKDALAQGQLKQGTQHLAQARKLQKLGYRERDKEIAQLSAELGEMNDWQNFATEPKRQELLTKLQAIVDTPLAPTDQADRLKQLRQSWNDLGRLRRNEQSLQRHFDDLAEQAFAPCKAHFSDQAAQRTANLQQRRQLCAQLGEFLAQADWQQTELKKLESISRQARAEWQSHYPCDHRKLKPVEKQFEALQEQLHDHIRQSKNQNLELKQQLVNQAQALAELDSDNEATGQAKLLQQRWQQIGPAPRKEDQRAWQAFRSACDQVFKRRAEAYQADKAALAAQLAAVNSALDELEQHSEADDLGELRQRFQAIEEQAAVCKIDAKTRKRMNAAEQLIKDRAKAQRRAQQAQRLEQWQNWDIQVSEAEQTNSAIEVPHAIFSQRCTGQPQTEDLHRLTLEAEIAADLPSPKADQQQRMALQIELINQGLSNMQLVDSQQLIERWCASGPKTAADAPLRTRFFAALAQRQGR
jgi:exonuclease SbcC